MLFFLQKFHSGWAYLTLLMGFVFLIALAYYAFSKKSRDTTIRRISLFTTLVFHIQLLMGVLLYFLSPIAKWSDETMKNSELRLYAMEHPLMMFAAVIFITVANSKVKKSETVQPMTVVFALIGLALVLSRIPWNAWLG
ncbi:MAG TPA: hypothetical protein VL022_04215 [Moheibacter sp.]|nr:hypothetical protein [Moheibacter sp.]